MAYRVDVSLLGSRRCAQTVVASHSDVGTCRTSADTVPVVRRQCWGPRAGRGFASRPRPAAADAEPRRCARGAREYDTYRV